MSSDSKLTVLLWRKWGAGNEVVGTIAWNVGGWIQKQRGLDNGSVKGWEGQTLLRTGYFEIYGIRPILGKSREQPRAHFLE